MQKPENTISNDQTWDYRVRAMMKEYSIYFCNLMLETINSLIPFEFLNIPIPILPEHTIGEIFSAEGRAAIKATIETKLEPLANAISAIKDAWSGVGEKSNVKNTEFRVIETFQAIITSASQKLVELLFDAFDALIAAFQEIWDAAGLPPIPSVTFWPDIDSLIDAVQETAYSTSKAFIEALLAIEIPGFGVTIGSLMGMVYDLEKENSETFSGEKLKQQIKQMAYEYLIMWPLAQLQDWIKIIKAAFLDIIGLVLPFDIPFTFCDCLNVVFTDAGGFPPALPV
jgi:hypothetical protein